MGDAKKSEKKEDKRKSLPQLFKPGQSGNPKGRPLGSFSIMTRIKQKFAENPEYAEQYIDGILKDRNMRKEILQQIDGKPVQPIAGVEGQPIVVQVIKYNDGDSKPEVPTT